METSVTKLYSKTRRAFVEPTGNDTDAYAVSVDIERYDTEHKPNVGVQIYVDIGDFRSGIFTTSPSEAMHFIENMMDVLLDILGGLREARDAVKEHLPANE